MSLHLEFLADVIDSAIVVPDEVASRLRARGSSRVRVTITAVDHDQERLALRGIDEATIERVATTQHYDRDVAFKVLRGEGVAHDTPLAGRLRGG